MSVDVFACFRQLKYVNIFIVSIREVHLQILALVSHTLCI